MSFEPVFLVAGGLALVLMGLAVYQFRKLLGTQSPATPAPAETLFSPLRYRPMTRLLKEMDFQFLASQPGYRPDIAARLRTRRIAIFRSYLESLTKEFDHLHRALRLLTLYADHDRSEVAKVLLEQRFQFTLRMIEVRMRLAFFWLGIRPIDVSGLVETVEALRGQVRQLSAPLAVQPAMA
ncbi:MAG: hypothetical protein HY235_28635 [Acidobacteria bacterium]|nr:hypothetical protein [Acidobacteriota bacterium]